MSRSAGYGYEILVVAEQNLHWPLGFLQWAVNAALGQWSLENNREALLEKLQGAHFGQISLLGRDSVISKSTPPSDSLGQVE